MQTKDQKHTVIHSGKFVELRKVETEHYAYEYTVDSRCNGELVAVLPVYQADPESYLKDEVVVHYEMTPCWKGDSDGIVPIHCNSITGGFEAMKHCTPVDTAVAELYEEAGIVANLNRLYDMHTCNLGKSSANVVHLFLYEVSDEEYEKFPEEFYSDGDGSWMEKQEFATLLTIKSVLARSTDPLLYTMIAKYMSDNRPTNPVGS